MRKSPIPVTDLVLHTQIHCSLLQVLSEHGVSSDRPLRGRRQPSHPAHLSERARTSAPPLLLPSQTNAKTHKISAPAQGQSFKYQY